MYVKDPICYILYHNDAVWIRSLREKPIKFLFYTILDFYGSLMFYCGQ